MEKSSLVSETLERSLTPFLAACRCTALLRVPVGRPTHCGLWHFRVSHSDHEVGDVLDPTSRLDRIANAVCVSRRSKESAVVVVRALEVK